MLAPGYLHYRRHCYYWQSHTVITETINVFMHTYHTMLTIIMDGKYHKIQPNPSQTHPVRPSDPSVYVRPAPPVSSIRPDLTRYVNFKCITPFIS